MLFRGQQHEAGKLANDYGRLEEAGGGKWPDTRLQAGRNERGESIPEHWMLFKNVFAK